MTSFDAAAGTSSLAPPLPDFNHLGIDSHHVRSRPRSEAWGAIQTHTFQISDGTGFQLNDYQPSRPARVLPVTLTTPWLTDLPGFNDHIGRTLAQKGIRTLIVGPEYSPFMRAVRRLSQASLGHDAYAHHLMLNSVATRTDLDTTNIANIGYSRGAMTGLALLAFANIHNRVQTYNDYTDPCLEHKVGLREMPWRALAPYVAQEAQAIGKAIIPHPERTAKDMARTLTIRPGFWATQIATGRALFSGEAGTFVDHVPRESHAHITLFNGSIFNHAADWERRFADFPNITTQRAEGAHLTGMNMEVLGQTAHRLMEAAAV